MSLSSSSIIVLIVNVIIAHLEYVRELVGHVHRHGAHPEEEADEEDVPAAQILLSDFAKYYLMKVC